MGLILSILCLMTCTVTGNQKLVIKLWHTKSHLMIVWEEQPIWNGFWTTGLQWEQIQQSFISDWVHMVAHSNWQTQITMVTVLHVLLVGLVFTLVPQELIQEKADTLLTMKSAKSSELKDGLKSGLMKGKFHMLTEKAIGSDMTISNPSTTKLIWPKLMVSVVSCGGLLTLTISRVNSVDKENIH